MSTEVRLHRTLTVLLAVALLATLTVALTGGDRADAVEGPVDVVYVTTGRNFPDALAGGTLAATTGAPMLTVEPQLPIPAATVAALQSLDPDRIIIFGGPVAVSDEVKDALTDHARSGSVTRIEGTDRHDTAAAIADALPSRVHDADRLDGLDANAFLRATGTAANSSRLDGVEHADLRTITLSMPGALEGAAMPLEGAAYFPQDAEGYAAWSFMLPPDRTAGDPYEIDLRMRMFGHPCVARFRFVSGVEVVGVTADGTGTYSIPSTGTDNQQLLLRATDPGDLAAGDVTRLGVLRRDQPGDTCSDISLTAAQVRY